MTQFGAAQGGTAADPRASHAGAPRGRLWRSRGTRAQHGSGPPHFFNTLLDPDDMKLIATKKKEQNHSVIDPWTVVHFATGLAAGLVSVPRDWALASAVAYELAEQYAERKDWGQELLETSRPESVPNAVTDVVVFMIGHRLGQAWNDTGDA